MQNKEILSKIHALAQYYGNIMANFGDKQAFSNPIQIEVSQPQAEIKNPKQSFITTQEPQPNKEMQTKKIIEKPQKMPEGSQILVSKITNDISQITSLSSLQEYTQSTQICDIQKFATKTVFGDGNANAKILIIGEAPGQEEDLAGVPFAGVLANF